MDFIYEYTADDLRLQGTYFESRRKDICVVLIHGMYANIIENHFAVVWGKICAGNEIGFLYGHTRGYSHTNDILNRNGDSVTIGTTYEIFEDCIMDIDVWLNKAFELGYKRVVLAGHSYGCNKVLYYFYRRRPSISGIIFASAPDMQGLTKQYEPDYELLLKETERNIADNRPGKLTSRPVEAYMPISSATFYNWYREGSNADNFPIKRNPEHFEQLETVDVPILTFSGADEDELYLQLGLLQKKAIHCPDFIWRVIEHTNHIYYGREAETAELIVSWLKMKI